MTSASGTGSLERHRLVETGGDQENAAGRPGARFYRRALATEAVRSGAGLDVLRAAIARIARIEPGEQAVA